MLIETAGLKCLGPPIIWLQPSLVLYKEFVNIQKKFPLKAGKKKKKNPWTSPNLLTVYVYVYVYDNWLSYLDLQRARLSL